VPGSVAEHEIYDHGSDDAQNGKRRKERETLSQASIAKDEKEPEID